MTTITKKCPACGNVMTIYLKVTGDKSYTEKFQGGLNYDVNQTALCTCFKIVSFKRQVNFWCAKNLPYRKG